MLSYSKFLVAAVMVALSFAKSFYGIDLGVDEVTASNLIAALTAVLVWAVPNLPKAK
ncbi:hypothetical protein [Phyllobacterium brassicacearum]|uniref:hypothetical protein n=1 Tax=Phyllobacterium brassicacearum TaxID=314235 RepID=UPI0010D67FD2|nr:hypothetical protein [Phyllobacterium brassicacearum]TDQ19828.1 hypothetical protein DEV91_12420 [Phyllobacterium brassicacearum]